MNVDPSIFKSYDIRGVYPAQINGENAYLIGRAYATLLMSENPGTVLNVVVGSDARTSSPQLKAKLIDGIRDSGVSVDDIGLVSTPTFYFAVSYYGYDGGIQVSASHNPKEWNGFKMVRKNAVPIGSGSGMEVIRELATTDTLVALAQTKGELRYKNEIVDTILEEQSRAFNLAGIRTCKIVIDGCNGVGSLDMAALFKKIPQIQLSTFNFELDGDFPGHGPNPLLPENIQSLRDKVKEEQADLGIVPDGDGDRYFLVDEQGQAIPTAVIRAILAEIELSSDPFTPIVYDLRPAKIIQDVISKYGGKGIVSAVGRPSIEKTMRQYGASVGLESSAHYYYRTAYGIFEAPILFILKFLEFYTEQSKPLSEIAASYKKYFNSGDINISLQNQDQVSAVLDKISVKYSEGKQSRLDGLSVEYPDFWFNIRPSNTEPLLRFILEAVSEEVMQQKRDEIMALAQDLR